MRKTKIICLICAVMMILSSVSVSAAISVGTVYDGTTTLTVDATSTYTDYNGNTVPTMTMTSADGNYGKLSADKVYKYSGFSTAAGGACDYINMGPGFSNLGKSYWAETQICITDYTNTVDYQFGYFYVADDVSKYKNGNLFRINASTGEVTVSKNDWVSSPASGTILTTLEKNRWYNISVWMPANEKEVYVYINGEEFKYTVTETILGTRTFRISTGMGYSGTGTSESDIPFVCYLDNVSCIQTESYDSAIGLPVELKSDKYTIADNKITLDTLDASAAEVLENVYTSDSARIRLYSDAAMTTQIVNDEGVTENSVLVVAALDDSYAETSYNYYTFTFPGAETNMYSGTQTLTLTEGGSVADGTNGAVKYPDCIQALTYPTAGTGGKKTSDYTYLWGGKTCGSGGHWYMNFSSDDRSSAEKPAYIFEMAFKLDEGATGFEFGPAPFTTDSDGNKTNNYVNVYPFRFTLENGVYLKDDTNSNVTTAYGNDGTNHVFKEGSRGIKLADIEAGKWHTFALVVYTDGTANLDVYVDGVKTSLGYNFIPAYMRHVRMYALAADDQKFYFDNFKSYGATVEEAKAYTCRDAKADVEFVGYEVEDNTLNDIIYGTTVADIKDSIVTDGNVRIYTDDTYTTLAADSDEVTEKTSIVVASTNNTAYERTYAYYSIDLATDYDELTGKTRITELAVCDADGNALADGDTALDEYYVTFTAKNLGQSEAAEMTVAIAVYDEEGTLVDIEIKKLTAGPALTTKVTVSDGIKIANTLEKGSVRAYVWYADSQQPFTQSEGINF